MNQIKKQSESCPLCGQGAGLYFRGKKRDYHICTNCSAVFVLPSFLPNPEEEKARYQLHQNDVNDLGYRHFVKPLTDAVIEHISPHDSIGLDYGCGPGPVAAEVLGREGYKFNFFDPFFKPDKSVFEKTYDFIICCEVAEHFHKPSQEFRLLKKMLKPGGKLFCMTNVLYPETDFSGWRYRNDATHVFFYTPETINFITETYNFKNFSLEGRLIIWTA